eukprot:CAMPEP_0201491498 /NCGR_PEP_ID=MMETSP0151_2-20130828/30086_1 /ASSEMBLY_ACC=CAM_ASM_000257 /TAXON_ID=200890 /ORGANISM="Paramoeba atlantica, Strain 621/1 / CCAP 1560/9" /LENGTH=406 /DNA_ID=CAMNT_0047877877 /DNA_START=1 /DNA_END=1217 /DNA_ORIENTATION=+
MKHDPDRPVVGLGNSTLSLLVAGTGALSVHYLRPISSLSFKSKRLFLVGTFLLGTLAYFRPPRKKLSSIERKFLPGDKLPSHLDSSLKRVAKDLELDISTLDSFIVFGTKCDSYGEVITPQNKADELSFLKKKKIKGLLPSGWIGLPESFLYEDVEELTEFVKTPQCVERVEAWAQQGTIRALDSKMIQLQIATPEEKDFRIAQALQKITTSPSRRSYFLESLLSPTICVGISSSYLVHKVLNKVGKAPLMYRNYAGIGGVLATFSISGILYFLSRNDSEKKPIVSMYRKGARNYVERSRKQFDYQAANGVPCCLRNLEDLEIELAKIYDDFEAEPRCNCGDGGRTRYRGKFGPIIRLGVTVYTKVFQSEREELREKGRERQRERIEREMERQREERQKEGVTAMG